MKVKEIKEKAKIFYNKHYDTIWRAIDLGLVMVIAGECAYIGHAVGYRKCYNDYNALLIDKNPDAFLEVQKTLLEVTKDMKK